MTSPIWWSTANDIKNHSWKDWIEAHTSFLAPLHHYVGSISITPQNSILITGIHKSTKEPITVEIPQKDVKSVKVGFDQVFKRRYDRQLGLGFQPLIIEYAQDTIYCSIELNKLWRTTKNNEWACIIANLIQ
jgi:hypothetical protein